MFPFIGEVHFQQGNAKGIKMSFSCDRLKKSKHTVVQKHYFNICNILNNNTNLLYITEKVIK